MTTISDLIQNLPGSLDFEKARGIHALIQFSLSGDGGGNWAVKVDDGQVTVDSGLHSKPDLIIKASVQDALELMQGSLNAVSAFMTGKVKIVGDMALAMKLFSLLK